MPYISPPPSKFKWMSPALASILFCLLSPPASAPCISALFVVDPISRFDPSCSVEADCGAIDWLTDTKAHQQAGIDASAVPITVPTYPFVRMNPSLSASQCQTQIRFFVLVAPDTHATPPAPPQHHLLFGLKRELEAHPSSHWFAVTGWAAEHPLHCNFPSCALRNLQPRADLRNSSCQKSRGSSLEGYSGGRDGRTGLAAYPFVWVHHDSMTWSTSRKCIWKSEMIVQFCKIEYCNTSLELQLPVGVCLAESKLLLLMMTYKRLT